MIFIRYSGSCLKPCPVAFSVSDSPLNSVFWLGPVQEGKQVMCRVHLVPVRSGLLALPRLDVTAATGSQGLGNVSFVCKAL